MDEVLLVQRYQNELVRGRNCGDLPIYERSRFATALKSRSLGRMPRSCRFVIG